MHFAFLLLILLLLLFVSLAMFDGFYLHIFRYKLHRHPESRSEHLTHTIRAILFPLILFFLFLRPEPVNFYIGITIVLADLLTLGFDAFLEKDSRRFMGGLPRWEYILHLFVNAFHFAAIAVFLSIKVQYSPGGFTLNPTLNNLAGYDRFEWLVLNILPGSVLMAMLHVLICFPGPAATWDKLRAKITRF
jgi:hypothetical protein